MMEALVRGWIGKREGDFVMADDEPTKKISWPEVHDVPKVAKLEPNQRVFNPPMTFGAAQPVHPQAEATQPPLDESDAIAKATSIVENFRKQQREQQEEIAKLNAEIKELRRDSADTKFKLLDAEQRATNAEIKSEDDRQEAADLRAFFSSMKAQFDHYGINGPMPPRKRNGDKQKALQEMTTKALQAEK